MTDSQRARVVLTSTLSLDGKIALSSQAPLLDRDAADQWLNLHPPSAPAAAARRAEHLARTLGPTAVLEGSGTFVATDAAGIAEREPSPLQDAASTELFQDHLPSSGEAEHGPRSWFVVIDSRGRVTWERSSEGGTTLLVLVARSTPCSYLRRLRQDGISYLVVGQDRVDLTTALGRLRTLLGIEWVVADSGGRLNAALLAEGLVEQVHVLVLPALVGGGTTPTLVDGDQSGKNHTSDLPARLRLVRADVEEDGLLSLEYAVLHDKARAPGDAGAARSR
jgi:riboflavin biosynthesis pyrimidine reductase